MYLFVPHLLAPIITLFPTSVRRVRQGARILFSFQPEFGAMRVAGEFRDAWGSSGAAGSNGRGRGESFVACLYSMIIRHWPQRYVHVDSPLVRACGRLLLCSIQVGNLGSTRTQGWDFGTWLG